MHQPDALGAQPRRRGHDADGGQPVRVVIADDSLLLRQGIVRVLEAAGFAIVGEARDGEELLSSVRATLPDVVITDLRMPPGHGDEGLRAAKAIRTEHAEIGVIVLSQYVDERYAAELIEDGWSGVGYLLKDRVADTDALADAVRRVAAGGFVLDPEVVAVLVAGPAAPDDPFTRLTPTEADVMAMMAEGCSNGAVAERLGITARSVERHVTGIFEKLELDAGAGRHRRVLAVLRFVGAA